jgi:Transposase DDE domain group 1
VIGVGRHDRDRALETREQAAQTFKKTFGYHPLTAWCDNTGELLVVLLRAGNAGSDTAADHLTVLQAAIEQIPPEHRRKILVTVDGAGSTHALVDHITQLNAEHPDMDIRYAVGFDLDQRGRVAIGRTHERVWCPALDAQGEPRKGAQVAELTGCTAPTPQATGSRPGPPTCGSSPAEKTRTRVRSCRCSNNARATGSSSPPPT